MDNQYNLNKAHVQQLREIATNLLKSGMTFSDVLKEVYTIAKTLAPYDAFVLDTFQIAAEYTSAACEGLNDSKPQKPIERK